MKSVYSAVRTGSLNKAYWSRDAPTSLTFNNCTLCPHCIYVFCIYLRTNSDLCHLQHKLVGFDMYMSYGWGSTGENVTSERHTRALQDVTSESYTTWRQICPTKDKISLNGSFTRMRILPRAYRNAITRIRFDASGYFSSSAIPLCACPVTCHSRYDNWTLIGLRCFWILLEFSTVCQQNRDRSGGGPWAINGIVCS